MSGKRLLGCQKICRTRALRGSSTRQRGCGTKLRADSTHVCRHAQRGTARERAHSVQPNGREALSARTEESLLR